MLAKIEAGFCHSCPVLGLTRAQMRVVGSLVARGLVRRLGATSRFPERFVLTANAHWYRIGTFDMAPRDFHGEVSRARRERRAA